MANPDSDYAHFFPEARKTRLPGGYMGKILRVDLTTGKLSNLNLPEEPLLRKYWGGQLLAEYLLLNELPLDIDPYDPRNVIVGMTGPVTGTGFTPGGTKMCFVYLSPATRRTLGRGATSGYLGTAFKAAGYDGVIVSGAAASPKYLYIGEDTVELRDASHVWGKGIRDTENLLRKESGHLDARVGCIGPAGENLVRAAMLVNDRDGLEKAESVRRLGHQTTAYPRKAATDRGGSALGQSARAAKNNGQEATYQRRPRRRLGSDHQAQLAQHDHHR
jgi:hypothetical protein